MITLDPQLERQLMTLSANKGLSISELIEALILDYQAEQEAIKRANNSYTDYKKQPMRLAKTSNTNPNS